MWNRMYIQALLVSAFVMSAFGFELKPLSTLEGKQNSRLRIVAPCVPSQPWTVAGEHGAIMGRQDGSFEAWIWPAKILSKFRIAARLADYPVPIDVNALAASVEVTPAETVITYSHAAFTIRQHVFAARGKKPPVAAVVAYFELESVRPLEVTFSFTPDMLRMWPAPNFGRPNSEWVQQGASGYYILHTDNEKFSGLVAMPNTRPGILPPYQEHPQTFPVQLELSFDPKADAGKIFPLLLGVADSRSADQQLEAIMHAVPKEYAETQDYYARFFDSRVVVETPDQKLNEAALWAEVAVDQLQVAYQNNEIGMVAGYYESADSARPGFAWFFGRDTLFTTYAMNSYGDFALTRRALDFLIHRQRDDGKVMHEFSQSAAYIDWKSTAYFYAEADGTCLLVMAMSDYVAASGDLDYLKQNWDAIKKAYAFTRAHDSDGDGIYDNSEGTGWVESWPPGMPHQEIYLAALDQQSCAAMARLAQAMKDDALSSAAREKASQIQRTLESEYFAKEDSFYAFSRNRDGSLDHTATIYPAVAWWDATSSLQNARPMLSRWASAEFSTDWGTRDISERTPFYDPISYHQGSVWPLFTGWVSLAEYRAGRSLSAYAHLMQNAQMTWTQDLGSVTELLSGQFFQPLGRSTSHQMWSSAMVTSPLLRGLFGLEWDALNRTLRVSPNLPATWEKARLSHVHLGDMLLDIDFVREGAQLAVRAHATKPEVFCLARAGARGSSCSARPQTVQTLNLPLRPVELAIPAQLPEPGSETSQLKAIDEQYADHSATFTLAAAGGFQYHLPVRLNRSNVRVEGAVLSGSEIVLTFGGTSAYQTKTVRFFW
ncbi:MAG: glycogen debranching protein [Acidobacteriaceae bacterium]|nr:glycogen debranching protein [Acidobacteriaceae bacterium]